MLELRAAQLGNPLRAFPTELSSVAPRWSSVDSGPSRSSSSPDSTLMQHILLPANNASTWTGPTGNNTWLLPGRTPTLIDAGVGNPEHIEAIAQALDGRPLALVLITHGHSDHLNGVPAITAR